MNLDQQPPAYASPATPPAAPAHAPRMVDRLRALPIRWRILSIATLNILVAAVFTFIIWNGAKVLATARTDLQASREADRELTVMETEAGRLQNLIHRYFTQPDANLLQEITALRTSLIATLQEPAFTDPNFSASSADVVQATERFLAGFEQLRALQGGIMDTYEN